MSLVSVGVLGATGMVGQRILQGLHGHPWLRVVVLAASERSAGKRYGDAATWRLPGDPPAGLEDMPVLPCDPEAFPPDVRVLLSALDREAATDIELRFRAAGFAVVSNAASHRQDPDVPLVIPEVNPHHLALIQRQPGPGYIVTNPNCCAIPLSLALAPLHRAFGVEAVVVATWQAVSGAGYPGESAWDMLGSVHPHAGPEEEKLAWEPCKILGAPGRLASIPISARCVRVPVADGHLLSVQVRLTGDPGPDAVSAALADFVPDIPDLPSSPRPLIRVTTRRDRPAPRFDADAGGGMAITVGRVERCAVMGSKFFCLGHNTIRGAAGAAIANVELLLAMGLLPAAR